MATPTIPSLHPTPTSAATPSCTTAVPEKYGYIPPEACNSNWAYSPSFAAAIAFSTIFGILTVSHISLAIIFRKRFCWVMIMGVGWELISFIMRTLGAHHQDRLSYAIASTLLFLLAPLWLNAYVYMTAGRLIWTFHPSKKVWGLKAISLAKYFVWLDIVSFLIQAVGGTMLSPGSSADTMKIGKDIYMSGIGVQQLFILLFFALTVRFQIEVQRYETRSSGPGHFTRRWKLVTYAVYAALVLITMRIIFRLLEFAAGTDVSNPLPYHEKYALALDAFPMALAITIMAVLHPGLALKGAESEFPSRKERKAEKKNVKAEKKRVKAEKKVAKTEGKRGKRGYEDIQENIEMNRVRVH